MEKKISEQIYEAIGEGYGFNGSKEDCINVIEKILNTKKKEVPCGGCGATTEKERCLGCRHNFKAK